MKKSRLILAIIFFNSLLIACSESGGRYKIKDDHSPSQVPSLGHVEDVTPRYEPYSRGGNKNYTVRGISYKVFTGISEFTESGKASWYGKKFHGHLTSNGERYNMYAMSAAHKNLPLPSYVKVTNLKNNKKIIVRVNDRGPFHEGRIIDLSYAAANKLDMLKSGTADVQITLLHFEKDDQHEEPLSADFYIQYLVTSKYDKAQKLSQDNTERYAVKNKIIKSNANYKLRLGPVSGEFKVQQLLKKVQRTYPNAFIVEKK